MNYSIEKAGQSLIITVDDLLNELENRKVVEEIKDIIAEGFNTCVVNLGKMGFMNSVGLNFVISILTSSRKAGGDMVMVQPSDQIIQLLEVTKLKPLFKIEASVEEALESLTAS